MESFLLIGGGELGGRVGARLRARFPEALIEVRTRTEEKHVRLSKLGLTPSLWSPEPRQDSAVPRRQFSHVLVAVPPRQSPDDLLVRALSQWNREGTFVYVSSTGVYAESDGGWIDEASPRAKGANPALEKFEDETLGSGGWVIRLAGLYSESRGPHRVYRSRGAQESNPHSWINLIHDDDAAEFCARALVSAPSLTIARTERILLGADGTPVTRAGLAAGAAQIPPATPVCQFTDLSGPLGKRCDPKKSWALLGFRPRVLSFDHFVQSQIRAR